MNWKHESIIYWSGEGHAFLTDVPELPGCMAHANTQSEALQNANEAIARELGRAIPPPKARRLVYA